MLDTNRLLRAAPQHASDVSETTTKAISEIEPGNSRTLSANHATRPNSQLTMSSCSLNKFSSLRFMQRLSCIPYASLLYLVWFGSLLRSPGQLVRPVPGPYCFFALLRRRGGQTGPWSDRGPGLICLLSPLEGAWKKRWSDHGPV